MDLFYAVLAVENRYVSDYIFISLWLGAFLPIVYSWNNTMYYFQFATHCFAAPCSVKFTRRYKKLVNTEIYKLGIEAT